MLILPPGHNLELAQRRHLLPRERRLIGGVGVLVAALVVAVVIGIASGPSQLKPGCIDVSFASSLGIQEISQCGRQARDTCSSVGTAGGYTGKLARLLGTQCRRQSLPVG
jgi:hypothetical protein